MFESALADRLAMLPLPPAVRQAVAIDAAALGAVTVPAVATDAQRDAIHHAARRAFVTAFRSVAALAAMLAALGALAAGLGVEAVPTREPDDVAAPCAHVSMLVDAVPQTQGCEECLRLGVSWVQLLVCLTCGHVGCCDSSRLHHATDHFWATAHPVVRSLEPGTTWRWCYVDETSV